MQPITRLVLWIAIGVIAIVGLGIPYVRFSHPGLYASSRDLALWTLVAFAFLWFLGRPMLVVFSDRRRPAVQPGTRTGVSIVVPCCNVESSLDKLVQGLLRQTYRPLEIVLVENNSSDGTWREMQRLVMRHREVTAFSVDVRADEYACSVAINVGVSRARHDVILRMDDDTYLRPDAVSTALAEMQAARGVAVACNLRVANPRASIWTRLQAMEYLLAMDVDRRAQSIVDTVICCSGGMSMFRRDAIIASGGFVSAPKVVSEDVDMTLKAHRLGRVAMAPEAIGFTTVPDSLASLARQRYRWAISGTVSVYLHRSGIANQRYWHNPAVGFLGLPARLLVCLRDLLAPVLVLDIYLLLANDGPGWFALLFALRMIVLAFELLLVTPAINRRDARQGLSSSWLIPLFVLFFGPLQLVIRCLGTWSGLAHVVELNSRRNIVFARGLTSAVTKFDTSAQPIG